MEYSAAEIDVVVQEIRNYLVAHPHAADSLEGIANWWLDASLNISIEVVEQAVEQLVGQRELQVSSRVGGKLIYSGHPALGSGKRS